MLNSNILSPEHNFLYSELQYLEERQKEMFQTLEMIKDNVLVINGRTEAILQKLFDNNTLDHTTELINLLKIKNTLIE